MASKTPAGFDPGPIHTLLDKIADIYHRELGDRCRARAEQFDSHISTVRMVVDHTALEAEKEQ